MINFLYTFFFFTTRKPIAVVLYFFYASMTEMRQQQLQISYNVVLFDLNSGDILGDSI